jgi:nucleoid-associated protein YgaU
MYRKFLETAKVLNIYLNHFPKHEKFALANKIRNTAHIEKGDLKTLLEAIKQWETNLTH